MSSTATAAPAAKVTLLVDCPHCGQLHLHTNLAAEYVHYGYRPPRCTKAVPK